MNRVSESWETAALPDKIINLFSFPLGKYTSNNESENLLKGLSSLKLLIFAVLIFLHYF